MRKIGFIFFIAISCLLPQTLNAQAPSLSHGVTYREGTKVSEFLVSEKLDGIRAYWDGKTLYSRSGNIIQAPAWFTQSLPKNKLDGELWAGRNRFEVVLGTVTKNIPKDKEWQKIKYMIFELPESFGSFKNRYAKMQAIVQKAKLSHLDVIPQSCIKTTEALKKRLDEITLAGGEGLMLHKADSQYFSGRSDHILKLKKREDDEATVLEHIQGKGKFTGKMGAILVKNTQGKTFRIGTGFSHQERENPPPVGSTITYQYFGLTKNGIPRFASFLRVYQNF